jgi:hypothetical protein
MYGAIDDVRMRYRKRSQQVKAETQRREAGTKWTTANRKAQQQSENYGKAASYSFKYVASVTLFGGPITASEVYTATALPYLIGMVSYSITGSKTASTGKEIQHLLPRSEGKVYIFPNNLKYVVGTVLN